MLDSLSAVRLSADHPGRTGSPGGDGVGWGEYFVLNPNNEANGTFIASLTLPTLYSPDANDKVCRYISEHAWDCAANSFATTPFNTITRSDVIEFSDWAVGNNVSPTAIRLTLLRAAAKSWDGLFLLFGAALAAGASALTLWFFARKRVPGSE